VFTDDVDLPLWCLHNVGFGRVAAAVSEAHASPNVGVKVSMLDQLSIPED
jgi:hypothetical protein